MYSVVLMAALTTGSATPDFGHHRCCGCYGGGCYGCYGCYGYYGYGGHGWGGGHGCWGYGCYGGCVGLYGCYGGWSCYGGYGCSGYAPMYGGAPPRPAPSGEQAPPPKKEGTKGETSARARLVVRLPADAQLYIDDNLMKSSSAQRTFVTPLLRPGQTYFYDLRADVIRDGKTVSLTRRVLLRPGDAVEAAFTDTDRPAATVAAEDR